VGAFRKSTAMTPEEQCRRRYEAGKRWLRRSGRKYVHASNTKWTPQLCFFCGRKAGPLPHALTADVAVIGEVAAQRREWLLSNLPVVMAGGKAQVEVPYCGIC
jgi:hypothetical protein